MGQHEFFMHQALLLADKAEQSGEVPIGAVVVYEGEIIGRGFNQPIQNQDPTCHAEVIAIRQAAKFLKNYRLTNCDLYTTLEPCPMCAGLMIYARIRTCVFAAMDPKSGAAGSVINLFTETFNHRVATLPGILALPAAEKLKRFFFARR